MLSEQQKERRKKHTQRSGLARALSKTGYCSRSAASELIRDGRVRVNGSVVRDPEKPASLSKDAIEVDGQKLAAAKRIYLVMNKPRGIVTTAHDEKGRETVYSLLAGYESWVAPVGRLDKASEGLLLLTNDSEWGALISAPETHVEKTYHVQIAALAGDELIHRLTLGVRATDRDFLRLKRASIVRVGKKNSWLEIVLDEGKNRQIRRLFAALGIEVLRLIRIAIGPLRLGDLAKGKVRELTQKEKAALDFALR